MNKGHRPQRFPDDFAALHIGLCLRCPLDECHEYSERCPVRQRWNEKNEKRAQEQQ